MSPNIFQTSRVTQSQSDPDTLPTPNDPTGPCPWCGRISNFEAETNLPWLDARHDETGWLPEIEPAILRCRGCQRATVVVTDARGKGIHWYPAPGSGVLDPAVSPRVASAYDEGMRCLGIGANRAAAVMFRSALSLFIKDRGSDNAKQERHLKSALKHMKADGDLHPSLWDWADHLNQLGNEGAHPEDYDDVTAEESEGLGKFVRHLIKNEYELPAELQRARGLSDEDE